jgi:hypothetical protein
MPVILGLGVSAPWENGAAISAPKAKVRVSHRKSRLGMAGIIKPILSGTIVAPEFIMFRLDANPRIPPND